MIEHIELTNAYEATPGALADVAAEAIRALNHATFGGAGRLVYPSNAYEVVGSLQRVVGMLDQSLDQLARFLEREHAGGRVLCDHGTYADDPDAAVLMFRAHITAARSLLGRAHLDLGRAHADASGLAANLPDDHLGHIVEHLIGEAEDDRD